MGNLRRVLSPRPGSLLMNETPQAPSSLRIWIATGGILLAFAVVLLQFFRLQIVQHEDWAAKARRQHEILVAEHAPRGRFFANTSVLAAHSLEPVPLVHDVSKYHLWLDPSAIPEALKPLFVEQLNRMLRSDSLQDDLQKKVRNRRIAMWLDPNAKGQIESWWKTFSSTRHLPRNALYFSEDAQRSHPYGKLAGQLLHTIRDFKDEETQQGLPTGGLELTLDRYLQGQPGKRKFLRSPLHLLDEGELLKAAVPGADIELTINHILQSAAEEALEKGVLRAKAHAGWAIVMEPHTGEILALAQYPFFDPSRYRDYFSSSALMSHTRVRAILDLNEPGSVIKPFTIALALQANWERHQQGLPPLLYPDEKIAVAPRSFPGRSKILKDVKTYRYLNMDMAIQKSSNVYMGTIAQRLVEHMGPEWILNQLSHLGFGQKTGVELLGEIAGKLPRLGVSHKGRPEWSGSTPYSLAMGHGLGSTSLQVARAYCALANGGYLVRPSLVRRIMRQHPENGREVLLDNEQRRHSDPLPRVLHPEVCRRVVHALRFACSKHGGGKRAVVPGYSCAGKSGTAEKVVDGRYSKDHNFSSFVGIIPAKRPRLVILVGIDEPAPVFLPGEGRNTLGGACAAPVFREIAEVSLQTLGVAADEPEGRSADAEWQREVQTLQSLLERWNTT
jgi:cell division protein FtsI (penicillin-binding protein 3)